MGPKLSDIAMDDAFPADYVEGLRLFNNGYYWHAHEALEAVWNECDGVDRGFYQGLIQVSAACFHIVRGNWNGARQLLHEASRRLEPAGRAWRGLDLAALHDHIDQLLDEVHRVHHGGKAEFDLACVPRLFIQGGPDTIAPYDEPPRPREE